MRTLLISTLAAMAILLTTAQAADIEAGKAKAAMCAGCHGGQGISPTPVWPNLAGQQEQYLVNQLKMFRSGERKNSQMSPMAMALTDEDIINLSAYYASLSCQ
jgi:cytochrome c553